METAYSILHNHLTFAYWLSLIIIFLVNMAVEKVVRKLGWAQSLL